MKNISVPELSRSYDDDNPTSGRAYNVTPWGLGFSDGSISREASTIGTPIVICVGVLLLFCLCFMPMYEICRHGRLPTGQSQEEQPQQQREELCTKEQKEARAKIIEAYVLQKSITLRDDNFILEQPASCAGGKMPCHSDTTSIETGDREEHSVEDMAADEKQDFDPVVVAVKAWGRQDCASEEKGRQPEEDDETNLKKKVVKPEMIMIASECAICLSSYKLGESVVGSLNPDCNHVFHSACIEEWLLRRRGHESLLRCPCCRRAYIELHEEDVTPNEAAPAIDSSDFDLELGEL